MTISRQDSIPLLTSVEEGRVWNCIERRPSRHEKMKKILQLKADRVGDGAGRGRKILQQRSTGWKGPRHRVRRALQQPQYPSGRWRPVTHTGTWLAGKEKQWERRDRLSNLLVGQGLCCSAADEEDDSGMLARSTATCRTNCGTSHIASMLGWLLEMVARDQLLFHDPMLACQTSWNCRSVVSGECRLYDCHVHLFKKKKVDAA